MRSARPRPASCRHRRGRPGPHGRVPFPTTQSDAAAAACRGPATFPRTACCRSSPPPPPPSLSTCTWRRVRRRRCRRPWAMERSSPGEQRKRGFLQRGYTCRTRRTPRCTCSRLEG
ncbi:uncharacterized protein LOC144737198 [Lampetra planeri]